MLSVSYPRNEQDYLISTGTISQRGVEMSINWHEIQGDLRKRENHECIFSEIFKELLLENNLTPKEFSSLANIPQTTVYQWTWGMKCEDPNHLAKLFDIFNVDFHYLFFGIGLSKEDQERLIEERDRKALEHEKKIFFLEQELRSQMDMFANVEKENKELKLKIVNN